MSQLREKFSNDLNQSRLNLSRPQLMSQFGSGNGSSSTEEFPLGHPKLEKLRDVVNEHFRRMQNQEITTRVMIFSQYRDSVTEITAMLHR